MEVMMHIENVDEFDGPSGAKISIIENSFLNNLAIDTVYMAGNRTVIYNNRFENSEVCLS